MGVETRAWEGQEHCGAHEGCSDKEMLPTQATRLPSGNPFADKVGNVDDRRRDRGGVSGREEMPKWRFRTNGSEQVRWERKW
jgi:hypothetical protein